MHDAIKFTFEKAEHEVINGRKQQVLNFLDVSVILRDDNVIETDVYYKKTNAHDYLNFKSDHPQHIKNNVPYNLAKRIIVFVSDPIKMENRLEELRKFLLNCEYPDEVIDKCFFNAKLQGPAPEPTKKDNIIPFVTTHYANIDFKPTMKKVKQYMKQLTIDNELKPIFENCEIVLSKRQPKNLLRHLTKAEFSSEKTNKNETYGIQKCTRANCKICHLYLQDVKEFTLSSGKTWSVRDNINCRSKNVIYYLTCCRCQNHTTYIGKTVDLKGRTNQHITGCRHGNGPNKFDNHVFNCTKFDTELKEPYFKLFVMMKFQNEKPLLTYESYLQSMGHDTMNK